MEELMRKLLEANKAQLAMNRELVGALTSGHVGGAAGAAVSHPGPQQVCLTARDAVAAGESDAAGARDAAARADAARDAADATAAGDEVAVGDDTTRDDTVPGRADTLARRDALGIWTAPPYRSELSWRVCGRLQGGERGVVCLATCWLHPQALHGLPHLNEEGLKAIKLECLLLKRGAGYHKPELGLGLASRQDLCDRLEARAHPLYALEPSQSNASF
ncbi:unnamed protein product [Boreogadus saida]